MARSGIQGNAESRTFRRVLKSREISGWVFDEARCLSKCGHDFRPDYLYAAPFIR